MKIKEYIEKANRTLADLQFESANNQHMILGMITEVGELADIYKKNLAYNKSIDLVNVREEVGDLMWYIANFCKINGFDLETILDNNINKLKARYPDKFSEEKANNRDLETERKVLEGFSEVTVITVDEPLPKEAYLGGYDLSPFGSILNRRYIPGSDESKWINLDLTEFTD